jgi:NitT/TauT family transport system substrate-binding protein
VKASAFYVDPEARIDVADIVQQVQWLKSEKLVDAGVDPKAVLDLTFVKGHMNAQ